MNKKQRSVAFALLAFALIFIGETLSRGGGGGGGHFGGGGRGMGGGGRGMGGGRSMGASRGGGRTGMSGSRGPRTGGQGRSSRGQGRGRQGNRGNRGNHGNRNRNTNVNVYGGGGYGYGYGAGWVAPAVVAGTGAAIAAGSAASAASSASSAHQAAGQASRAAGQASRAASQTGIGRSTANHTTTPLSKAEATNATRNAQPLRASNPGRVNNAVTRQAQTHRAPQGGSSTRNHPPARFRVDGHNAHGFWHNGRFYATWFWGGVPYYWWNGFWTPWLDFWTIFPWWYDFYYTPQADGISFNECDTQYDCPDGDCPPACDRYYE